MQKIEGQKSGIGAPLCEYMMNVIKMNKPHECDDIFMVGIADCSWAFFIMLWADSA